MAFTDTDLKEKDKLVWAGLKRAQSQQSAAAGAINKLKSEVPDYADFKSHLDAYDLDGDSSDEDISNFTQFKTYLQDKNFTSDEADNFIAKIKNNFEDDDNSGTTYDEFEAFAESQSTYTELKNGFSSETALTSGEEDEDGNPIGGIRVLEGGGVTYAGVSTSQTTTEVFGRRIEHSQSNAPAADDGDINYSNIRVTSGDDKATNVSSNNTDMTIAADVENTASVERQVSVTLLFDGSVRSSKSVVIGSSSTVTVSFTESDADAQYDAEIGDAGPLTVSWAASGVAL